jgi:hypothetical protein
MVPYELLQRIRALAESEQGLFRVHQSHPDVYARARRQFGSWARAVQAAGIDYRQVVALARVRALRSRREKPAG